MGFSFRAATRRLVATAAGLLAAAASGADPAPIAMPANPAADQADWWKRAVVYEIYPRSFADSNNDGIGDIAGITRHLDYIAALGVDAIWMTPMFPSPQVDFGYDVSDYDAVDPQFGTVADVDGLIADGKARGVKLLLDFVVNHTSDQHPWFVQSRSSRTNPYRDFYIWRDPKPGNRPPNNWTSLFGGSAWTTDPASRQAYYHFFYPQQPDLNWRNPKVEKAMFDAAEWWLKRGVYGYRLDAVDMMFERADLKDNIVLPGTDTFGMPNQSNDNNINLPEVHTELRKLRAQVIDRYPGRILIGETWTDRAAELVQYYGPKNNELQLPMYLSLIHHPALRAANLRKRIGAVETNAVNGWPCFSLSNHDNRRAASRYSLPPGATTDDWAKITGALLLTLRGTPVLYYGEELGMVNNDPQRLEDVQDVFGKKGWPKEKGRDGERTPMQWDATTNAGFNGGAKPWLPVAPDYTKRNVAAEMADPNSVLSLYRALIAQRRTNPAMAGDYRAVDTGNPQLLAYQRSGGGRTVLVLLNLDAKPADEPLARASSKAVQTLIASNRARLSGNSVHLDPLGIYVAGVEPAH
jgi:alpha-glucosidase